MQLLNYHIGSRSIKKIYFAQLSFFADSSVSLASSLGVKEGPSFGESVTAVLAT